MGDAWDLLFGDQRRAVTTIVVTLAVAPIVHFLLLPRLLTRRATRSPRLRRYLEWVVATPSLLGDSLRVEARHDLMRLANSEGLYERAAGEGFAILRHGHLRPALVAE